MSAAPSPSYQASPALAPAVFPRNEDWSSPDFLGMVASKDPCIQLGSHYDQENDRFVHNLLRSDFDLKVVVDEMETRAWHHSKYFNGDREYSGIRKNLISIYNGMARALNKLSFESQFNSKPEALAYACQLLDSNPGARMGKAGLRKAREQVTVHIDRKDMFVPILGDLPTGGLYWVEFIIHDDDREGKGSYHNFFGSKRNDVFIQLYAPETPAHIRHYPVIKDRKTYNSLLEDFPHTDILGWELVNGDCCDDHRYKTPAIWHLATKPVLKR